MDHCAFCVHKDDIDFESHKKRVNRVAVREEDCFVRWQVASSHQPAKTLEEILRQIAAVNQRLLVGFQLTARHFFTPTPRKASTIGPKIMMNTAGMMKKIRGKSSFCDAAAPFFSAFVNR